MMGGEDKNKEQNRRPYYFYGWGGSGSQEEQSTDKFRVDADVENNKLLLWANQIELDEVYKLLAKLGEIPARGSNTNTVRVLNVEPGEDTAEALERLRRAWPSLAPNPLLMPDTDALNGGNGRSGGTKKDAPRTKLKAASKNEEARSGESPPNKRIDRRANGDGPGVVPIDRRRPSVEAEVPVEAVAVVARPAVLRKTAPKSTVDEPNATNEQQQTGNQNVEISPENSAERETTKEPAIANDNDSPQNETTPQKAPGPGASGVDRRGRTAIQEPPPINVSVGANGELIITSPDTEALDLFEEMVNQIAPPRKEYKVFRLKHASAFSVTLNLEEYFQLDDKDKNKNRSPYFFYFDDYGSQKKDDTRRLSKRRELKFIYDTDTNTVLVQGADPSQLRVIEELIQLYDTPEPMDSRAARMTTVFTLKYSKAKTVGETVKDVYRDLLSQNDKALQGDQQKKEAEKADRVYITNFGDPGEEDPRATQVKFKGKLSIGIDELSNTLVVSTEGENLMNNVSRMIEALDQAAKPAMSTVQVLKLGGRMDSKDVQKAIARAFVQQQQATPQQQGGPQQGPNGQQQPGQNGQQANQNGRNPQTE